MISSVGHAQIVSKADGTSVAKVTAGEFYVSIEPVQIMTVLGSCVSACIRDPDCGVGGINHFMLPVGDSDSADSWGGNESAINRFGNYAMESLIDAVLALGGARDRLEIKLFGGGHVLDINSNVGQKNVDFVLAYLAAEGLPVVSMDVGHDYARKVVYEPSSGRARMKKLRRIYNGYVAQAERDLLQDVRKKTAQDSVRLFENERG